MFKVRICYVVIVFTFCSFLNAQTNNTTKIILPNGWSLSPAGRSLPLGDLPLNIAVSSSKKLIAVTNNGQSINSIQLINPITEQVLDSKIIDKSWYGLKFSDDEKSLFVSGGNDNFIIQYAIENNKLIVKDTILLGLKWPNKISPTGIEIDDKNKIWKPTHKNWV